MSESLGQLIRERRRQRGMTQGEFAKMLGEGVRQAEISRLESGLIRQPRIKRLHQIATVLEIPVGKLLELTPWATPEFQPLGRVRDSSIDETSHNTQATDEETTCFLDSAAD